MRHVIITIITLFIICCEDQKDQPNPNRGSNNFILVVGETVHDSLIYREFNPTLKIKGLRIGTDSNYIHKDSLKLDLDKDGTFDIQFAFFSEFHQPKCNCAGIDCCMPWGINICKVQTLNNLELASISASEKVPKRLIFGDTLENQKSWIKSKEFISFAPMGTPDWNINYFNSFMGFRIAGQSGIVYGWLRLNTHTSTTIEITDYVIEKRK